MLGDNPILPMSENALLYRALGCDITLDEVDQQDISSYFDSASFQIRSIFSLRRAQDVARFPGGVQANHRLLFHGTKPASVLGILARGLLLPLDASSAFRELRRYDDGWLGSGIYFSSTPESSRKFSLPGKENVCYMLVATVALGKSFEVDVKRPELVSPPSGYDSVKGVKGTCLTVCIFGGFP
jgi:hypothetical protein